MGSGIGDVPTSGNVQRGFLKLNLFHLKDFCDKEYCSALETDFFFLITPVFPAFSVNWFDFYYSLLSCTQQDSSGREFYCFSIFSIKFTLLAHFSSFLDKISRGSYSF